MLFLVLNMLLQSPVITNNSMVYSPKRSDENFCFYSISSYYEGCSNMNASSFITFFIYMLRQHSIRFWKEIFVAFKMAPNIKKHSLYFSNYRRLYKATPVYYSFSEANCNARFGTCALYIFVSLRQNDTIF